MTTINLDSVMKLNHRDYEGVLNLHRRLAYLDHLE